jgi:hypothetical protein
MFPILMAVAVRGMVTFMMSRRLRVFPMSAGPALPVPRLLLRAECMVSLFGDPFPLGHVSVPERKNLIVQRAAEM